MLAQLGSHISKLKKFFVQVISVVVPNVSFQTMSAIILFFLTEIEKLLSDFIKLLNVLNLFLIHLQYYKTLFAPFLHKLLYAATCFFELLVTCCSKLMRQKCVIL